MKIINTVEIKNTPQVVFGWLEKPEKATRWMSSVSRTEILHETPERVGTTFRETVQDDSGTMEMHGVITGFEPDRSISFHLSSRVNVLDVAYSLEEIPGGVRLVEHADIQWKFPVNLFSIVLGNKMREGINAQLQSEFQKLKELCEGGAQ